MNGKKILLFTDWYEPGYKAGGPIRSCVNFAGYMQQYFQIYIFTSDRDLGSASPYENIEGNTWLRVGPNIQVYYCSPDRLTWRGIKSQLTELQPDFIYLHSMFSTKFTLYPLLINRTGGGKSKVVLAPKGMLRASAIQFKTAKKKLFLKSFRWLGFHKNISFHATDDTEARDVRHYFGSGCPISMIPNFPAALPETPGILEKKEGELAMIYVGRVHPIKNLDFLLNLLGEVTATVRLTIVGSLEDPDFWKGCQQTIQSLPENIKVTYAGEMPNHEIPALTAKHHLFILPTKGENFGHAIFEALALGKPVLISDQTPWRKLEAVKAGWDLPLDRPDLFREAIRQAAAFGQAEYTAWCEATLSYVRNYIGQLNLKEEYLKLFH